MNFTSTSNNILNIESLDIRYKMSVHGIDSLRDVFVRTLKNPARILFKKRPYLEVLNNINLTVNQGDRLAILGVNGSGKTSLCRAIAGMHGLNNSIKVSGEVRAIFDTSVAVHPELSGRENAWILTNLLFSAYSKSERESIVKEAIEFSELDYFIDTPFKRYSKGMKTRLFLSVVSARPSDLLILDEVFSGADSFFNEKISARVEDMIQKSGAVIFISHIEEVVEKICNRGVVLNNKQIEFDGPIADAIRYYNKLNKNGMLN